MTGFGRGVSGAVGAELRSVNHRFAEVTVRSPRELAPLEDRVRRLVLAAIGRGRVDVNLFIVGASPPSAANSLYVDKPLAQAYDRALKELADSIGAPWQPNVGLIASLPGVLVLRETVPDVEAFWPDVQLALDGALERLCVMRASEGAALAADLAERTRELTVLTDELAARTADQVGLLRTRLAQRLAQALGPGVVDPNRLEVEVALLAERSAVDEEIVRLRSHLQQFRTALAADVPVGRKLDFIVQELNREVSTIGSKVGDAAVGRLVVEAKVVVEKLREQLQNVE